MSRSSFCVVAVLALSACADVAPPTAPVAGPSLAAAAAKSGGSVTKTNEQIPISGILQSFCTGESVVYSGRMHVVTMTQTDASGTRTRVHTNFQNVQGTAVPSGRRYEIMSNNKERTEIEAGSGGAFEQDVHFRVISQGSLDNWFVRVRVRATLDANGNRTATTEQVDNDCRG